MPPRVRRVSRAAGRGNRRRVVWATHGASQSLNAGTVWNSDLLTDYKVAGASLAGVTIMRTHIRILLPYSAATESWYLGLIVGRATDVGINLAQGSAIDPLGDQELPWLLNTNVYVGASGATFDAQREFVLDIRSKRKMHDLGEAYILSFLNTAAGAHVPAFYSRTLLALP